MNKYEKTHIELKKQLASMGIYDSDYSMELPDSEQNDRKMEGVLTDEESQFGNNATVEISSSVN